MKVFLAICRVVVGTLFVLSGLIKANDPYGFTYKLEEYFEVFEKDLTTRKIPAVLDSAETAKMESMVCKEVMNLKPKMVDEDIDKSEWSWTTRQMVSLLDFFKKENNALFLAVFICVLEIVLGICAITGYSMRIASWLLFLMIIFFTFLTFYSAYYNKVTDCGCFGDALKLSPWQSFYKDIFLLVFILPLFIFQKRFKNTQLNTLEYGVSGGALLLMVILCILQFNWYFPVIFLLVLLSVRFAAAKLSKPAVAQILTILFVGIASAVFAQYTIGHLAAKDYRPWKVGSNLRDLTKGIPEQAEVVLVYVKKDNCELVDISMNKEDPSYKLFSDTTFSQKYQFVEQKKKVIKAGIDPKVKDFTLDDEETGMQMGDSLIHKHPGYALLFVARDLKQSDVSGMDRVREIAELADKKGVWFLGATSSYGEEVEQFRHKHQLPFKFYTNDATSLKTILRPGPGLVLLKDGVVIGKWQWNDIPSVETFENKYFN